MRANLSDAAYSTIIGLVARIPVQDARRLFLERVEAALPAKGKIADDVLAEVVNKTLQSFRPGQWVLDGDTWRGRRHPQTLKEWAQCYPALCRGDSVLMDEDKQAWPPIPPPSPPPTPGALRAIKDKVAASMSIEEAAAAYQRTLVGYGEPPIVEPVPSKPITMADLPEPEAVEEFVNYVGSSVDLKPEEFHEVAKTEHIDQDDEFRPGFAFEQRDDEDAGMSEMMKAARLAKRFGRGGGGRGGGTPPVFFNR